jgi:hypothetical protein
MLAEISALPTPGPTYTPFPTQTPLPTYTLYPTPTALPTYVPFPSLSSAIEFGREPFAATLETDADVLLGSDGPEKNAERVRIRQQIRELFEGLSIRRAGIVLTFGTSPVPAEGNRLAAEVNQLLLEEFPDMFDGAALRSFHTIDADPANRGIVDLEVHFLLGIP